MSKLHPLADNLCTILCDNNKYKGLSMRQAFDQEICKWLEDKAVKLMKGCKPYDFNARDILCLDQPKE